MISYVLLILLLGAPANPGSARQAYAKCLRGIMVTDLKSKTNADAFQAKLATICQAEAATFKQTSVASDVASGIQRAAAEQNASDDMKDMLSTVTDRYKEYLETNTSPE